MPGYQLIEEAHMQPRVSRGIARAPQCIGLLDFMRELNEEPFPFPKFTRLCIVGLEEALFAARPNETELAIEIHRRLNDAASDLERRLLDIQVLFTGKIVRGADLIAEYRGAALPIGIIFNHPKKQQDANGNAYYPIEFHLSSP